MKPYPWSAHVLCSLPLVATLLVIRACIGGETDVIMFFREVRGHWPAVTPVVNVVTDFGNYCLYCMYVVLLVKGVRKRNKGLVDFVLCFILAFTVTLLAVHFIKNGVGRARPYTEAGFFPWAGLDHYRSFPSGHTTEALLSVIPICMVFRGRRLALGLGCAAGSVALTRLYLEMHHPSDLWGGIAMGNLGAFLVWSLFACRAKAAGRALPPRLSEEPSTGGGKEGSPSP